MMTLYDQAYNIYDHKQDKDNQLSMKLVAMHPREQRVSPFKDTVRKFISYEVAKYTNLTLEEFLNYPRHRQDDIIEIVDEERRKRIEEVQAVQDTFESDMKNLGKT